MLRKNCITDTIFMDVLHMCICGTTYIIVCMRLFDDWLLIDVLIMTCVYIMATDWCIDYDMCIHHVCLFVEPVSWLKKRTVRFGSLLLCACCTVNSLCLGKKTLFQKQTKNFRIRVERNVYISICLCVIAIYPYI